MAFGMQQARMSTPDESAQALEATARNPLAAFMPFIGPILAGGAGALVSGMGGDRGNIQTGPSIWDSVPTTEEGKRMKEQLMNALSNPKKFNVGLNSGGSVPASGYSMPKGMLQMMLQGLTPRGATVSQGNTADMLGDALIGGGIGAAQEAYEESLKGKTDTPGGNADPEVTSLRAKGAGPMNAHEWAQSVGLLPYEEAGLGRSRRRGGGIL